jgi:transposase
MATKKMSVSAANGGAPMPERRGGGGQVTEPERAAAWPVGRPPGRDAPAAAVLDAEVPAKAARRRFTAEYKLRILREADACITVGAIGGLLRREGLYSSHLTTWRHQREQGALAALAAKPRGRPAAVPPPWARRVAELEGENVRLAQRLKQAETIIAAQKKLSEILAEPLLVGHAGA